MFLLLKNNVTFRPVKKHVSISVIALVAVLSLFILVSCTQDVEPSDEIAVSNTFGMALKPGSNLTVNATYKNEYFSSDSSEFNKDMAMLSFAGATCMTKEACQSFYKSMGFSNEQAYGWDTPPTTDSVAFFIASRRVGSSALIGITVRGFNYESEWVNNLTTGATGNHEGFTLEAEKILAILSIYIKNNISDKTNLKIWIMGYSRGGGISGLLAHKIIDAGLVKEKDMYAYTFEAPTSLGSADTCKCIHSIRNSADLIPYVPPVEWGFYHAGVETDIYSENIRTWLIDELGIDESSFPVFTPSSLDYPTPPRFASYLMGLVESVDLLSTRAKYAESVQGPVTQLMTILLADGEKGLDVVIDYFSGMEYDELAVFLLGCMEDPLFAYNRFKDLFDAQKISYDDEQLRGISAFINTMTNDTHFYALAIAAYLRLDNVKFSFFSHYPEVTYIALKHYSPV